MWSYPNTIRHIDVKLPQHNPSHWCEATMNTNRIEDIDSQSNSVHILPRWIHIFSVKIKTEFRSFLATKPYKNTETTQPPHDNHQVSKENVQAPKTAQNLS